MGVGEADGPGVGVSVGVSVGVNGFHVGVGAIKAQLLKFTFPKQLFAAIFPGLKKFSVLHSPVPALIFVQIFTQSVSTQ